MALPDSRTRVPSLVPVDVSTLRIVPPGTFIRCARLDATVRIEACLLRRSRTWPSGKRRGAPCRRECQDCGAGELYARRCPWYVPPPPSQAPEVMTNAQRRAKAMWKATQLDPFEPGELDPLAEAASLSPDDALIPE